MNKSLLIIILASLSPNTNSSERPRNVYATTANVYATNVNVYPIAMQQPMSSPNYRESNVYMGKQLKRKNKNHCPITCFMPSPS